MLSVGAAGGAGGDHYDRPFALTRALPGTQNKTVTCQHHAADTAISHRAGKGRSPRIFATRIMYPFGVNKRSIHKANLLAAV